MSSFQTLRPNLSQEENHEARLKSRPSFKNIINVQGAKVMGCGKMRATSKTNSQTKDNSGVNKQIFYQPSNIKNLSTISSNKVQESKHNKVVFGRENQIECNFVNQLIHTQKKIRKLQERINDQQQRLHRLSVNQQNRGVNERKEWSEKRTTNEEQVRKLKGAERCLQRYMKGFQKQIKQIQEGYCKKLSEIAERQNSQKFQNILKQHNLNLTQQFAPSHTFAALDKKIRSLQLLML